MEQICRTCLETKPLKKFELRKSTGKRRTECNSCRYKREKSREASQLPNPARDHARHVSRVKSHKKERIEHPERVRNSILLTMYNLTTLEYEALFESHEGCCWVCGQPETFLDKRNGKPRRLGVDHDHSCCPGRNSCGRCVRGLLCRGCNTTLGNVKDNPDTLRALATYVESHFVSELNPRSNRVLSSLESWNDVTDTIPLALRVRNLQET